MISNYEKTKNFYIQTGYKYKEYDYFDTLDSGKNCGLSLREYNII